MAAPSPLPGNNVPGKKEGHFNVILNVGKIYIKYLPYKYSEQTR